MPTARETSSIWKLFNSVLENVSVVEMHIAHIMNLHPEDVFLQPSFYLKNPKQS